MCDPCRYLRRCISCHGVCCPRPSCCERSCSSNMRNCRVVFPGEFQKFSDVVTPSFLLKTPERPKKRKRSKSCSACEDNCKDPCSNMDACAERCENPCQDGVNGCKNPEDSGQDDLARTGAYGTGYGFQPGQPTIIPCYGTYGPSGNAMIFGIPPPTEYGGFGVPGPIVLPVAPPSSLGQGDPRSIPAAGLPTQYTNKFNPCTGEVYECGDRQMPPGRPQGTAQVPSYNQFIQGLGMGFAPNSQYIPFNEATFQPHPINQMPVTPPSGGTAPAYSRNNQPMNYLKSITSRVKPHIQGQFPNQSHQGGNCLMVPLDQSLQFNEANLRDIIQAELMPISILKLFMLVQVARGPSRSVTGASQGKVVLENYKPVELQAILILIVVEKEIRILGPRPSQWHPRVKSHDSRKRNKSVGAPTNRQPLLYGQQSMGMGIDPSNQYYPYNECTPLNATFVQDNNPFYDQPGHDVNRPQEARAPNLSMAGPKRDTNSNKVPSSFKPSKDKSSKCCCTRFDPNNQYYSPHYVSEESDCPPSENANSGKKNTQEKNCLELLSRLTESCPPCDLQKWCHLLMPKDKDRGKKQAKPSAKKNKKPNGSKIKNKMSEHSSKEIEDTETSPVETPENEDADCPCNCKKPCPSPPTKPEMRTCGCSANLPEENEDPPPAPSNPQPAPCNPAPAPVNTCCMPCSNQCPWSWYFNPCTGCYYYCANCCNGCRNCCNYCCSPCGRCCSNSPAAQLEKIPPKPKQKERPDRSSTATRNSGGATVSLGSCAPPPSPLPFAPWNCPRQEVSTMPGYSPTASPHFSSPYSGRWVAGGVDIHRNYQRNNQGPSFNVSRVRHA
ncbi:GM25371 [Drosophila sechellia]|uniref:GM25371 n=1 Tax=Drosophila sechellia TaxID=7238 RepID=B4HG63_DROSE|nr:GM25371 [Drosophila sechellia]